jgi:protein phosphatase
MRIRAAAGTDIGRARERNEDAYLLLDPLYAVADGMGGHRGGDVASSYALEVIRDRARERGDEDAVDGGLLARLVGDIEEANQRVRARGEADHDLRGMGTTLTAFVQEDGHGHLAHVGDSRAYLFRDGALQQLTEDHTLVQRMVREGKLTPDEAGRHPHRSMLTRALGVDDDVSLDELTLDLHPGDRFLLCSDGLTSMVDAEGIALILGREEDPKAACALLIDAANEAGGDDNITVVLLDVVGDDDAAAAAATPAVASVPREPAPAGAATALATAAPDTATRAMRLPDRSERAEPPVRRPIRWGRIGIVAGLVAVVVVAAVLGARAYVNRQWYVGESGGSVAIFNGIPTEVLGVRLSHVVEVSDVPVERATALRTWQGLHDGITAKSLEDARSIVAQIETDTATGEPPPSVSPSPAPSPSASG